MTERHCPTCTCTPKRTLDSPATAAQVNYVRTLMRNRAVPTELHSEIWWTLRRGMTDGECRRFIPELVLCPTASVAPPGRGHPDDADYGDWEDWRDHPDAVFGDPNEHGSH